jgi:GYF domain
MSSSSSNSLRPAWNRGNSKGFHPPPQVEQQQQQTQQQRNQSSTKGEEKQRDYNKFSALNDDDDNVALHTSAPSDSKAAAAAASSAASGVTSSETTNSRSEGLRPRASSFVSNKTGGGGRSLADLAARAPERTSSRFSNVRSAEPSGGAGPVDQKPVQSTPVMDDTVIRFTRERLLSLRPPPREIAREALKVELEGSMILSETAQDPVCWDNLDAEEIWATVARRVAKTVSEDSLSGVRRSSSISMPSSTGLRREASTSSGRWQRGVALPPEGSKRSSNSHKDADDPSDLWDDPGSNDGAAMDFSAFGSMPEDGAVFDFEKMAQASKKLEDEMHGRRSRASSNATSDVDSVDNAIVTAKVVNPSRPLATAGTTIRSGSGDDVNVFEDFDDPALSAVTGDEKVASGSSVSEGESSPAPASSDVDTDPAIKSATEDPTASSRLMAMIGVKKDDSSEPDSKLQAWGEPAGVKAEEPTAASIAGIPLNPWGGPIVSLASNDQQIQQHQQGLDLQARLRQAELEQQQKVAEENRRRLEQEEAQRRQLQEQERLQAIQQQAGVQSQVELVLMERISTILENSWGRSDLVSILATLHAEDSRVIPLLSNVDALRALLLRNPRRVAIRQDPALRAEMAALLITNAQWQQHQQQQQALLHQQQLQQQQQEELVRREQQRRLEEQQAAALRSQQQQQIMFDAPWFYSDPSKNIQGPFRGEEMRQWLEAGYFKGDLPISQSPSGPFRPLSMIFADLSVAFINPNGNLETEVRAKGEEQQRRELAERARIGAEAAERERLREEEQHRQRKELEAAEKRAREEREQALSAARAAELVTTSNGGNESSTQLKLMLGLGSQSAYASEQQGETKIDKRSTQKMPEQKRSPSDTSSTPSDSASQSTKNATTAWGGVTASQPVSRKSMSEIQKEEARAAAVAAMNRQSAPTSSSAWANVAAARGGSTAWSGGEAKQQPAVVLPGSSVRQTGLVRAVSLQTSNAATVNTQPTGSVQRANSVVVKAEAANDAFGAKMPPTLEKWCKDQMHKLNGTDDLTLVAFCMSLTDADEIRQYLTAYLGSTPQVNSFATEFINRKGGAKDKVEEWEPLVKKGRKKKA